MFKEDETQHCPMCEEWVEKYEQRENDFNELKTLTIEIGKQNRELNKEIDQLKIGLNILDEIKEQRDNLAKDIQYQNRKLVELEFTLQEIAKIANQGNAYCLDYNLSDCDICIKQYDCKTMFFKQIMDKIDEVEQWT